MLNPFPMPEVSSAGSVVGAKPRGHCRHYDEHLDSFCPKVTGRHLLLSTLLCLIYSGCFLPESLGLSALHLFQDWFLNIQEIPLLLLLGWVSPFQDRCQTEGSAFGTCVNHACDNQGCA